MYSQSTRGKPTTAAPIVAQGVSDPAETGRASCSVVSTTDSRAVRVECRRTAGDGTRNRRDRAEVVILRVAALLAVAVVHVGDRSMRSVDLDLMMGVGSSDQGELELSVSSPDPSPRPTPSPAMSTPSLESRLEESTVVFQKLQAGKYRGRPVWRGRARVSSLEGGIRAHRAHLSFRRPHKGRRGSSEARQPKVRERGRAQGKSHRPHLSSVRKSLCSVKGRRTG